MRSAMNLTIINDSTPNCCRLICMRVCSGFLLSDSPNPAQLRDNRPLKSSNTWPLRSALTRVGLLRDLNIQASDHRARVTRVAELLMIWLFACKHCFFFLIAIFLVFKFLSAAQCIPVSMESQGKLICFQLGDCFCDAGYKYLNIIPVWASQIYSVAFS